ncbi:MAG: hypothetical protein ACYTFZ_07105, partial [Planctomycetota bacterium]
MGHLKRGPSGHLLRGASGHLVNDCSGMAENACNECWPPIPDTLTIAIGGGAGMFVPLNGSHSVDWIDDCTWYT